MRIKNDSTYSPISTCEVINSYGSVTFFDWYVPVSGSLHFMPNNEVHSNVDWFIQKNSNKIEYWLHHNFSNWRTKYCHWPPFSAVLHYCFPIVCLIDATQCTHSNDVQHPCPNVKTQVKMTLFHFAQCVHLRVSIAQFLYCFYNEYMNGSWSIGVDYLTD